VPRPGVLFDIAAIAAALVLPLLPLSPAWIERHYSNGLYPAIDLLLCRQWGVSATLPAEAALEPGFAKHITARFERALPLVTLLNAPLLAALDSGEDATGAARMSRSLFGLPKPGRTA